MRKLVNGLLVLVLVVGVGACGDDDDDPTIGGDDAGEDRDSGDAGDVTAVGISGSQFDPTEIEVSPGDVTFEVTNEDSFAHTFTVDDAELRVEVAGGETATATGSFGPGDYDFRCEIHPSMTGTISAVGGGQ